nr:menaquinone-dependent protoporphyrinogen IX dehydrogenase [Shimwellia pseudoproteus]
MLFSTRDGQTHKIARHIAGILEARGKTCELVDLHQCREPDWANVECVVIGASIRYGHFHKSLSRFVNTYAQQLKALPGALFTVNLVARKPEKQTPDTNSYTRKFLEASPWQPQLCQVFAGALRYPHYTWYDRMMIRLIMKMTGGETDVHKEVEYTDWQAVAGFAQKIAQLPGKMT